MPYKYPFIPKEYYRAVMFACNLIREHKTFNRACRTAADYYNVDEDEVRKHVSARAAAGHKGKKHGTQSWFVVTRFHGSDASGYEKEESKVVRGKSLATVENRFLKESGEYNRKHDRNGSSYSWAEYYTVVGPFDTKAQAQEECETQNQQTESKRNEITIDKPIAIPTRYDGGMPSDEGAERTALFALLQATDMPFAQKMLDRKYPGWRDTDLSIEQVYPLRVL